jgi:hypothetical protein
MGILDKNNDNLVPLHSAKMVATNLITQTRNIFEQMVRAYNQGSRTFWANGMGALPADIAAELGTDAKEIFELHYKLGQLIASVKPEAIEQGSSLVGNFTINEDGTVTIIENNDAAAQKDSSS